jgi:hypothetical protein
MSNNEIDPRILESIDESKRSSIRKLILGSAFAAPVVASFSMDGLVSSANAQVNGYTSNLTR